MIHFKKYQHSLKAKCSFWNTFIIWSILIYDVQCLKYVSYKRDEYEKLAKIFKSLSLSFSISVSLSPSLCVLKHLIEKKTNSRANVGFQIYADMYPKFSRAFIFILYVYTLFYMLLLIRTRGKSRIRVCSHRQKYSVRGCKIYARK